ncbi:MAG: GntR family transcriptional regulator [Desulfobacteraceae bacterium]|jgi:GntR family negative regulator for fad regulon and positive regulator of fabA
MEKPVKPGAHARREIIRKIIQAEWKPGMNLPSERKLSEYLGVTRATLREVLKLMEKEGWISIKHGKPSTVKNFWDEGGLGILTGLNENKDLFPFPLIIELLEVRAGILPICAKTAFNKNLADFRQITEIEIPQMTSSSEEFTHYDWRLQEKIVELSENRVYKLVYNEFRPLFLFFGKEYFKLNEARVSSVKYYNELNSVLSENKNPEDLIFTAMTEAISIWKKLSRD